MYISGTHSLSDVSIWHTIPLHTLTKTARYKQAEQTLSLYPEIHTIVGHSLGAAIGQELVGVTPSIKKARLYGSPTILLHPKIEYYRHNFDPVSMMNVNMGPWGTKPEGSFLYQSLKFGNPHSYRFKELEDAGKI